MIRTVALGVVCLAGVGAIAAAAKKSPAPRPAEIVFPVAAGDKADRLPITSIPETTTEADKVSVVYIPPVEDHPVVPPQPPQPSKETKRPSAADFVPRHWHDPHDLKNKATKPTSSDTRQANRRSQSGSPNQIAEARSCRTEGLDGLLRKLNLSSPCQP